MVRPIRTGFLANHSHFSAFRLGAAAAGGRVGRRVRQGSMRHARNDFCIDAGVRKRTTVGQKLQRGRPVIVADQSMQRAAQPAPSNAAERVPVKTATGLQRPAGPAQRVFTNN
jgi:hypothetical protein